jgi:hypothetical protein
MFHGPAQLFNGLLDVRQINPGNADKPVIPLNIFGNSIVIRPCQLAAELGIALIDQWPVIRNQNLDIKTVLFHELSA